MNTNHFGKYFSYPLLGLVLGAPIAPVTAVAGVFSITPVRIYITPKDRAVAVTLKNEGDSEIVLQADIYSWTQKPDGTDNMKLTEDLLLSPPIVKLAPKAHQVVRLAMLAPRDPARQMTYRMIMREVIPANNPRNTIQVPIALALNLPVFVTPPAAKREISCEVVHANKQPLQAACSNTGTAYAQIREIVLKRKDHELAHFNGGSYILPGARKTIDLKTDGKVASGSAEMLITFDDFKNQTFTVSVH